MNCLPVQHQETVGKSDFPAVISFGRAKSACCKIQHLSPDLPSTCNRAGNSTVRDLTMQPAKVALFTQHLEPPSLHSKVDATPVSYFESLAYSEISIRFAYGQ